MKKSLLKTRITILKWVVKKLEDELEQERRWFTDERNENIKYAKEIEYKTQLLKNIISTP